MCNYEPPMLTKQITPGKSAITTLVLVVHEAHRLKPGLVRVCRYDTISVFACLCTIIQGILCHVPSTIKPFGNFEHARFLAS